MPPILDDLRYSIQSLRRSPGFFATVVFTLALGVGGTVAIYTFVRGVLLRPLPIEQAERLVMVCESHPDRPDGCGAAPGNLWDMQKSRTLSSVGLGRSWNFGLKSEDGRSEGVRGGVATVGLFDTFLVEPLLGRLFERTDHLSGGDQVVLLSHSLWSRRFGGQEDIVGSLIDLDEEPYRVIGVLPEGFAVPFLEETELWIALWASRADWRDWRGLRPYGRLADGVTLEQAQAELGSLAEALAERYPESNSEWGFEVRDLHQEMVASVKAPLLVFLGAVGLVLVIACINTAILLLVRSSALERELAMRLALGAGRGRLLALLLNQSLVLALAGGALGVGLASLTVRLFTRLAPVGFPRLENVELDGAIIAFAILLSLFATLLAGLAPAWKASRCDPSVLLRAAGRTISSRRTRSTMVIAEVALATMLLVGAGLLARSFLNLVEWQPGFETERVITFNVFPPLGKYSERAQLVAIYQRINQELSSLPGVVSVGEVSAGPLFGGGDGASGFRIEGRPEPAPGTGPLVHWYDCGPNYFATLGIPLVRGRAFGSEDRAGAPLVAVVNETMANRHWPESDPLGERVFVETHQDWFEIVGVVADTDPFDPRTPIQPEIYWPLAQVVRGATYYAVRVSDDPDGVVPSIEQRLLQIEPDLSVGQPTTLIDRMDRQLVLPRFQMWLLGLFAAVALTVAMVGIYGVTSFAVVQRTRELGIRMALGAHPEQLRLALVRGALFTTALGVLLGLTIGLGLSRFLSSMLVEVSRNDPTTLALVVATLFATTLAAASIPARRATRIEPTACLREE